MTPAQKAEYDKLRKGATEWLDSGGLDNSGNNSQRDQLLGSGTSSLMDTISGKSDKTNLNNMLGMQRDEAVSNLEGINATISDGANMTGGIGGSKMGIAQGLATSNANSQLANQQNKTMFDWQNKQDANKASAINQAMGMSDAYSKLSSGPQDALNSLSAYKQLISGEMGGETEARSKGKTTGTSKTSGFDPAGAAATGAAAMGGGSDERLKKNIKNTGGKVTVNKTGEQIKEKSFEYTKEAQDDYGMPEGEFTGVLAQDVEKEDPSAVSDFTSDKKKKKKRKAVDYDKLDKMMERI